MTKKKKDKPEIVDKDPPLQEITPETELEKKRKRDQEAIIRQNILDQLKEKDEKDNERRQEDKKRKINKTRKCNDIKHCTDILSLRYRNNTREVRL